MRRGLAAGAAAVMTLVAAAAEPVRAATPSAPDTVVIRDDRDRALRVAAPPDRIVSLIPAVTEVLFALGADDRLVGRTRYGTHPSEARSVPSVGEGVRPSLEAVLARSPDVVILYAGVGNRRVLDRLEELGVPTLAFRHDGFADLERNVTRLGRLTGHRRRARALRRSIACQLDSVARAVGGRPRVRVYYEVWGDPPVTVGGGSYLDSLVSIAGGRNVFGELEAPSPTVGLEAIVARDPDLVVHARSRTGGAPPPGERPGWEALEAVRSGRVRAIDGDLVHRLGPRVGRAAAELAATLHPSASAGLAWDGIAAACRAAARAAR